MDASGNIDSRHTSPVLQNNASGVSGLEQMSSGASHSTVTLRTACTAEFPANSDNVFKIKSNSSGMFRS